MRIPPLARSSALVLVAAVHVIARGSALALLAAVRISSRGSALALVALLSVAVNRTPAHAQSAAPLPGTITEHVHWSGDAKHGFTVYRPSKPIRPRAPLLIVLDPSGDHLAMVRAFAPAAEKLGWVVASAEDSRSDNGDENPTLESATAMYNWAASGGFAFDARRVYLTGMSGTARMCWMIWRDYRDNVAGIIGAAASVPVPRDEQLVAGDAGVSVALTAGNRDFNYAEVRALGVTVDGAGTPSRFASFDGPHAWPPADEIMRTLEWLEVRAMLSGRRALDSAFVHAVFAAELSHADTLAADGKLDDAERAVREVTRDAKGWPEGVLASAQQTALLARPELIATRAALKPMLARELAQQDGILKVMAWEENREVPPSVDDLLDRLGARALLKDAVGADHERALSARRQLARLRGMLGFYTPTLREKAGKADHAARLREAGKALVVP